LGIIWRIVRIGIPNSVMSAQWGLGGILLIAFVVPYGTVAVAAHTLVGNIMGYVAVPSFGLARAAGVLVGQNLGAKQPQRAQRSAWLAVVLAESFILIVAAVVLVWPENLIRIFSPDPEVIRTTALFMRIALASILAWVFSMIFEQSLSGAGDTLPPMLISLLRLWAFTLPLAWFLPHLGNLGVLGIRWAIVAGEVVDAAAFITYFQLGCWMYKKV
jgi:Na+-driven multidrug efflux pump